MILHVRRCRGARLFRCTRNRRSSLRWFEPNTGHL
jgi:hypothetical protein